MLKMCINNMKLSFYKISTLHLQTMIFTYNIHVIYMLRNHLLRLTNFNMLIVCLLHNKLYVNNLLKNNIFTSTCK